VGLDTIYVYTRPSLSKSSGRSATTMGCTSLKNIEMIIRSQRQGLELLESSNHKVVLYNFKYYISLKNMEKETPTTRDGG
jgi:hypothetical protein